MTISFARAVTKRRHESDPYGLAEREQQFQYEVIGQVGLLPTEQDIKLKFALLFMVDSGNQRDSTLDRPHLRVGFEEDYGPPGLIPYAKVVAWDRDDDDNYQGATMRVGCHCPAVGTEGMLVSQARFKFAVHLAFQGWCVMYDPEGGYDAGGNIDLPNF